MIETTDAELYAQAAEPWELEATQLSAGPFLSRQEYVTTGGVAMIREGRSHECRMEGLSPADLVFMGGLCPARPEPRIAGVEVDTDTVAIGDAGSEVAARLPARGLHWELLIDRELLIEAVDEQGIGPDAFAGLSVRTVTGASLGSLTRHITRALDRYASHPFALEDPLLRQEIEASTIGLAVQVLAGTDDGPSQPPPSARRKGFLRALEIISVSPKVESIPALAAQAGVSQRTLQYAFQHAVGVTPIRYIRLERLNRAHRALRRADPTDTTVTSVAGEHGFTELGRFSVEYRRLFGESPSQTLRAPHRRPDRTTADALGAARRAAKNA